MAGNADLTNGIIAPFVTASPGTESNPSYDQANAVRLPMYINGAGENGTYQADVPCRTGDVLMAGGCNARNADGNATCFVARSNLAPSGAWHCECGATDGNAGVCRASVQAICLKAF